MKNECIDNLKLAADTLRIQCAKRGYTATYLIEGGRLKGRISTQFDVIEFVLRFIKNVSGLLHVNGDHYRIDVLKSDRHYDPITSTVPQNAVVQFLSNVDRNDTVLCDAELTDEEQNEEQEVKVHRKNELLQGGAPVPIDGFSYSW